MNCGTLTAYNHGCRCAPCRTARGDYKAAQHLGVHRVDREALATLLQDICPDGLTTDCPARKKVPA